MSNKETLIFHFILKNDYATFVHFQVAIFIPYFNSFADEFHLLLLLNLEFDACC